MKLGTPVPDPEFLKVLPASSLGFLKTHIVHIDIAYIPDICQFWYTAISLRPVKSTPKSAHIRDKIAKICQNGPK